MRLKILIYMNNQSSKIEEIIRNANKKFIEEDLTNFLKISSYTLNKEAIIEAKDFIISYISDFCEDIKEIEGEINPLLLAKVKGKIKDSLLIYMMYDTQPVNKENKWISNPFGAEVTQLPKPLDRLGNCVIARGAYNSKTPLLCFLNVVKILKKEKKLPISLLLLFDGEEELGSPTLLKILENRKNLFNSCLGAYYPSMKQDLNGNSVLKLGYKGILSLTVRVTSTNEETHSAFSSMVPNPALDLISLLSTIYSKDKFKINSLRNPYHMTSDEQSMIKDLMKKIDLENIKNKAGITQTLEDDTKKSFVNYLFNPTFNISTLKSGYLEDGVKNMVANNAKCNIDIRFAHNVSINDIYKEIRKKVSNLARYSKSKIEFIKNIGYERSKVKLDSILVKSLIKSFDMLGISTHIWPISAAAAPLSKIQKELAIGFVVGGLGIGGFAHAPNEFIQINSIVNTKLSNYLFLQNYAILYNKENK
ncbi:Succinyl-diaminopimelate desuccinylase [subsurface metagenome]